MAEGPRVRIGGVWLERCWSRRPGKAVYDRDRTHVERHCVERGEEGVGS